jgi:glycosyltransferase involved in cell wall biosynthesis
MGVTFIIPSIGRETLKKSIDSLYNQTNNNWCAIIIFDGVKPNFESTDKIKVLSVKKIGSFGTHHGESGLVRNFGLDLCETEWVAFLDDDDTLDKNYVDTLLTKYMDYDLVIWKMRYPNGRVLPYNNNIIFGNVGISISFKSKLLKNGLRFDNNRNGEDFDFIKKILDVTKNYIITDEVYYNINN